VPVFKPSQLPPSASFGFAVERDAKGCLVSMPAPPLSAENAATLTDTFGQLDPCMLNFADPEVRTVLPSNDLENSQVAVRARLRLGDLDLGLSYYYGRFSFPVAYDAVATTAPSASDPSKIDVKYVAEVMYPRIQVAGLDFSYTAPWMFDIGLVGEIAVYFPEEVDFAVRAYNGTEKVLELRDVNVPSTPFIKATVGLDYAFTKWALVNAMYVHGFFDEFNDRYGLAQLRGADPRMSFVDDSLKIQISAILDCNDLSNQVNPDSCGWGPRRRALAGRLDLRRQHPPLGQERRRPPDAMDYSARSKFGQKGTGRSLAYLRAKRCGEERDDHDDDHHPHHGRADHRRPGRRRGAARLALRRLEVRRPGAARGALPDARRPARRGPPPDPCPMPTTTASRVRRSRHLPRRPRLRTLGGAHGADSAR
jgi:hypothetical protein